MSAQRRDQRESRPHGVGDCCWVPLRDPAPKRRREFWPRERGRREGCGKSFTALVPVCRIFFETAVDGLDQRMRQPRCDMSHGARWFRHMLHQQGRQVGRLEGELATHREIADRPERVQVAPAVNGLTHGLLGAHELCGPHDPARIRIQRRRRAHVRDAEIRDQRSAGSFLQQDVVRLHVPVDDPASVCVRQRPGYLTEHARRLVGNQWSLGSKPFAQRDTGHVAHHEEDETRRLSNTMDGDDVRMGQSRSGARLTEEPFACVRLLREVRRQHLDRDVTVQLHIARKVDHAHPAAAQFPLERVLASERGLEIEKLRRASAHASPCADRPVGFRSQPGRLAGPMYKQRVLRIAQNGKPSASLRTTRDRRESGQRPACSAARRRVHQPPGCPPRTTRTSHPTEPSPPSQGSCQQD